MLAAGPAIAADDVPVDLSDVGVRGRLSRIVKPDYPEQALARGQTGVVTLEGVVGFDGFVDEYKYIPDKPESAVFVDALKAVAPNWIFTTPIGDDCQPVRETVRTEVSFEIDKGSPRIFVTHAKAPPGPPIEVLPHYKAKWREVPIYPKKMQVLGVRAKTYAKLAIDRDGKATVVDARSYTRQKNPPDLTPFTRAVEEAVPDWVFPKVPPESKAPWYGCFEFVFRLR